MRVFVNSLKISLIGLLAGMMMGGCGSAIYENNDYYYPNWIPDGRIICFKIYSKSKLLGPGKVERFDTKYYVTSMDDDGSNEQNLFDVSSEIKEITCSPTGELIAYITEPDGSITISNYSGSNKTIILNISNAKYLDWSPDAQSIVYTDNSRNMYITSTEATSIPKLIVGSAEVVAWRVGNKIAYSFLYTIDPDGNNNEYLTNGGKPQITNSGKILYYADLVSPGIYKIKAIFPTGTGESLVLDSYERNTLKLSFDNNKIVGGEYDRGKISGIWGINIDGSGSKQLR
jgi:hypothetical protein